MPESRGVLVCQLDCLASRAFLYLTRILGVASQKSKEGEVFADENNNNSNNSTLVVR
jgi:hypothetical protein